MRGAQFLPCLRSGRDACVAVQEDHLERTEPVRADLGETVLVARRQHDDISRADAAFMSSDELCLPVKSHDKRPRWL
jgi:hypothetical protein